MQKFGVTNKEHHGMLCYFMKLAIAHIDNLYFGANIMPDELHGHIANFLKVYTSSCFKNGLKCLQGADHL